MTETDPEITESDQAALLDWFEEHRRNLPWRSDDRDPYPVWVSEVMLQQTRVDTVIPYFEEFMKTFPRLEDLAEAEEEEVLNLWEGLGFYTRARNLHSAAKKLVREFDGTFPRTVDELETLPGIGPATAAAIASFSFQKPVPFLDGNVFRVISRYAGYTENTERPEGKAFVRETVRRSMTDEQPGSFNEALIELGALICTPSDPVCEQCPLRSNCVAYEKGIQEQLPFRGASRDVPNRTRTGILIRRGETILMVRRPSSGLLGGMWEPPALWNKENETLEETARRTMKWALGRTVQLSELEEAVTHTYSHFHLKMPLFRGRVRNPATGEDAWPSRWVTRDDLDEIPIHGAAKKALDESISL